MAEGLVRSLGVANLLVVHGAGIGLRRIIWFKGLRLYLFSVPSIPFYFFSVPVFAFYYLQKI